MKSLRTLACKNKFMHFHWYIYASITKCLTQSFYNFHRWQSGPGHVVQGPRLAVSCAALVLAVVHVWLSVSCLRRGKNGGVNIDLLIVSGMSADICIYWSSLAIHIDAIA